MSEIAMIILTQSPIHAMMHGVAWFELQAGRKCTAVYTDGTRETAEISKENADAIRAYHNYQSTDGSAPVAEPNGFSIVGDIQEKRA